MISIILDESGTLSINNKDKYFVIAGYMCKDIRKIKFIHKKVSNNFRTKLKNKIENFKRQSNNETIENFYQKNNFWTLTHYKQGKILIQGKEIIELIEILNIEI